MINKFFGYIRKKPEPPKTRSYRYDGPEKLLETLRALDKTRRGAYARNAYYMKEFGVTDRTIRRWIATLIERGEIRIEGQGKGRRIFCTEKSIPVKPQMSYIKPNPDNSTRKHCPENVRVVSGQRPGCVRDYNRSNDRNILKSQYDGKTGRELWLEEEKRRRLANAWSDAERHRIMVGIR